MGPNIKYQGNLSGDFNQNDSETNWDDTTRTITWVPMEKSDVVLGDDGWLNDVAEISYRVELVNFQSSGLVKDYPTPAHPYNTNSSATLSYAVSTTINGEPSEQVTPDPVKFTTPVVRGLLYDIVATKTDGNKWPLPGAEFGLFDESGNMLGTNGAVVSDKSQQYTAISGQDGKIVFENLPHGTYVVKENDAPDGYVKSNDEWTVYL